MKNLKKKSEKADEERKAIRGELPPIEEIIKNFEEAEREPAQDFYNEKRAMLRKEARYEMNRMQFRNKLKEESVENPFLSPKNDTEDIQEEKFQQMGDYKIKRARWKQIMDFTGGWISIPFLCAGYICAWKRHPVIGSMIKMLAALQSSIVTIMNIRNWVAGEREFDPFSVYNSELRFERKLPLKERKEIRPLPSANLYLQWEPGIQFGRFGKKYIGKPQSIEGHVLVVGQPGTGKSTAFAIPTISRWTGGMFCIDVKGELSKNVPFRNNTFIVDPEDEAAYGYDPFEDLRRVSENERVHYMNGILYSLLPDSPDGKDIFWTQSARRYLAGAYFWGLYEDMSFVEINSKIYSTSADDMIRQVMNSGCSAAKAHMVHIEEEQEKTRGSILQNAMNAIEIFATDYKIMEMMTRKKTVNPEMLLMGSRIFVKISDDKIESWRPFLMIMTNQFIRGMTRFPDGGNQKILVLLDEFPRLGKIASIVDGMATLRSKGCSFCLLVQSYSQIDKIYGEIERRIILDNTAYKLIMSIMDPKMAEETSQMIGQHYESERVPNTGNNFLKRVFSARTKRWTYLIRPEKLRNLGKEAVLIYPEGFCRLVKTYYFEKENQ